MPNDTGWKRVVRLATVDDLPEIMRMFHEMHDEHGMFPVSEARVMEFFNLHFSRTGRGVLAVAGPQGALKGMIFLFLANVWYSNEGYQWNDAFLYSDKKYRHEPIAKNLLAFAKWVSDESKLPLLLSVMSNRQVESKVRLFRRSLGPADGASFMVNAPPSWKREPSTLNVWSQTEPQRIRGGRKHKANRREQHLNGGAHGQAS